MREKKCPFCGGRDVYSHVDMKYPGIVVECFKCGARGPRGNTHSAAFGEWRTRCKTPSLFDVAWFALFLVWLYKYLLS
jgi:Lar family restriction alleviation protein